MCSHIDSDLTARHEGNGCLSPFHDASTFFTAVTSTKTTTSWRTRYSNRTEMLCLQGNRTASCAQVEKLSSYLCSERPRFARRLQNSGWPLSKMSLSAALAECNGVWVCCAANAIEPSRCYNIPLADSLSAFLAIKHVWQKISLMTLKIQVLPKKRKSQHETRAPSRN